MGVGRSAHRIGAAAITETPAATPDAIAAGARLAMLSVDTDTK
jgi:hypothetical protein